MNYHLLMLENQTIFTKKFFEEITSLHLSFGQPKILEYLLDHQGCMQKDIAKACFLEPATVTSVLSKMEKDKLVIRKNLNGNRRSLYVYLTDEGKEKAVIIKDTFEKMEEKVLVNLDDDEKKSLLLLLEKVNKNLWNL